MTVQKNHTVWKWVGSSALVLLLAVGPLAMGYGRLQQTSDQHDKNISKLTEIVEKLTELQGQDRSAIKRNQWALEMYENKQQELRNDIVDLQAQRSN